MADKMKKLSLLIDLEHVAGMEEEVKKPDYVPRAMASNVIKNVLITYAKGRAGLAQAERKKFHMVCDLLDKAVADKADVVEMSSELTAFLRQCFRDAVMVPNEILRRAEALVDGIKDF